MIGLNEPQVSAGVQLQSTPAAAVSFVTVAVIDAVPFTVSEAGGAVVMATVIAPAVVLWLELPQAEIEAARISVSSV